MVINKCFLLIILSSQMILFNSVKEELAEMNLINFISLKITKENEEKYLFKKLKINFVFKSSFLILYVYDGSLF